MGKQSSLCIATISVLIIAMIALVVVKQYDDWKIEKSSNEIKISEVISESETEESANGSDRGKFKDSEPAKTEVLKENKYKVAKKKEYRDKKKVESATKMVEEPKVATEKKSKATKEKARNVGSEKKPEANNERMSKAENEQKSEGDKGDESEVPDEKKSKTGKEKKNEYTSINVGDRFVHYTSLKNNLEVIDEVVRRSNGSVGMVRILRPAAQSTATTSLCNVIIPEKIERPVDTKDWKIDPHEILSPYMRYSVAAMYAIGSISENQSENYRVLSVGLGGGILNAHLRHSKNNVNSVTVEINPIALELSKKYFGFEKDDRQQCIIQDGAQYVQEAAKRGERFHCILIDACVQGVGTCPALVFLNESVVASYPKILHETGILIVNYLMRTETLSLEYVVICVRSRNQLKLLKSNEFNEKIADLMRKFWKERQCEPYCI